MSLTPDSQKDIERDMYADFLDFMALGDYPNMLASIANMKEWNETLANCMQLQVNALNPMELNWYA